MILLLLTTAGFLVLFLGVVAWRAGNPRERMWGRFDGDGKP